MFHPPRCPNARCPEHQPSDRSFFVRKGVYRARCRKEPVPRFRCRTCGRGFSRQTFRADYRDHRPELNERVFQSLASGVGLRQTARNVGLSLSSTVRKFRKIARHASRLNRNLRADLPSWAGLMFDEFETYETRRNSRPLTVPFLIEPASRFVLWARAATIRPHGRMSEARRRAIFDDELRFGPRKDTSRRAILRAFESARALTVRCSVVRLATDEKTVYPALAREAFGSRLVHRRTSSRILRGTWNPLFAINNMEAIARDLLGRLRRNSWLVSKKRRRLDLGMQIWIAYHNFVRRRVNADPRTPAQTLGFVDRRMRIREVLAWRQDWGARSVHPLSKRGESIAERMGRL